MLVNVVCQKDGSDHHVQSLKLHLYRPPPLKLVGKSCGEKATQQSILEIIIIMVVCLWLAKSFSTCITRNKLIKQTIPVLHTYFPKHSRLVHILHSMECAK